MRPSPAWAHAMTPPPTAREGSATLGATTPVAASSVMERVYATLDGSRSFGGRRRRHHRANGERTARSNQALVSSRVAERTLDDGDTQRAWDRRFIRFIPRRAY